MRKLKFTHLVFVLLMGLFVACEGPKGPAGTDGQDGVDGVNGTNANACLAPCHNTGGVWEQYRDSRHFAEILRTEEQETFTGGSTCGKCHAKDALATRLDGTVGGGTVANVELGHINYVSGTVRESTYDGDANFAQIQCVTCHVAKSDSTNQHLTPIFVAGNFPLRVTTASGIYLEKSSGPLLATGTQMPNYGSGNTCMMCHKSRKDVADYVSAATVTLGTSRHWGPHYGTEAELHSGFGGYHYGSNTYNNSSHIAALNRACVDCHMGARSANANYAGHDFKAAVVSSCTTCHPGATTIASIGTTSKANIEALLVQLRSLLHRYTPTAASGTPTTGLLAQVDNRESVIDSIYHSSDPVLTTSDSTAKSFDHDYLRAQRVLTFNPSTGNYSSTSLSLRLPKDVAGALYNYFVVAKAKGYGAHNYKYAAQLLYDSIVALGGTPVVSRPS